MDIVLFLVFRIFLLLAIVLSPMNNIRIRNLMNPVFESSLDLDVPGAVIGNPRAFAFTPLDPEVQLRIGEITDPTVQLQDAIVETDGIRETIHAADSEFNSDYQFSYAVSAGQTQLMGFGIKNFEQVLSNFTEIVSKLKSVGEPSEQVDILAVKPLGNQAFLWFTIAGLGDDLDTMNAAVGVTCNNQPFGLETQIRNFYMESPLPTPYSYREVSVETACVSGRYHFEPDSWESIAGYNFAWAENFIPSATGGLGKRASALDWLPMRVRGDEVKADTLAVGRVDLLDVTGQMSVGAVIRGEAFEPSLE